MCSNLSRINFRTLTEIICNYEIRCTRGKYISDKIKIIQTRSEFHSTIFCDVTLVDGGAKVMTLCILYVYIHRFTGYYFRYCIQTARQVLKFLIERAVYELLIATFRNCFLIAHGKKELWRIVYLRTRFRRLLFINESFDPSSCCSTTSQIKSYCAMTSLSCKSEIWSVILSLDDKDFFIYFTGAKSNIRFTKYFKIFMKLSVIYWFD